MHLHGFSLKNNNRSAEVQKCRSAEVQNTVIKKISFLNLYFALLIADFGLKLSSNILKFFDSKNKELETVDVDKLCSKKLRFGYFT